MPNKALFRSFLNTERIGREIFCPETTGSTMDFLKQRADDLSDGAAVICGEQTSGRGRRGRKWTSGKNQSLALSFLLKTPRTRQISAVTLVCGLACANALNRLFGSGFGVKWPNDPIFSGKKIGGILCESILSGDSCSIVCGIGINLTQDAQFFIDAGLPHAASIFSAAGAVACFEQTAAEILNQFEPVYQSFLTGGAETFLNDYRKNCVTLGHMVKVSGGGRELEGLALDVFPDGRLAVKTETGVEKVEAGDVSVRGIMGYSDL